MDKSTYLCLECLKTGHTITCPCGSETISLGKRKLAEWVSQHQGDRKAILKLYDSWNYQSPLIKENRFLIWLHGFEFQSEIKTFHPDRWRVLVNQKKGVEEVAMPAIYPLERKAPLPKLINRWLIEDNKRYRVEILNNV